MSLSPTQFKLKQKTEGYFQKCGRIGHFGPARMFFMKTFVNHISSQMKSSSLLPFQILGRSEIVSALDNLSEVSVAVIGDFCLDIYWTIDRSASEISVETGLKTEPVQHQRYAPGGAGNVVMNLMALGIRQIYPMGVLGNDPFGCELRRLLECSQINCQGLISQNENWATPTYIKPCVDNQELSRIDFGNFNCLSDAVGNELLAKLEDVLGKVSVVLINHQVTGSIHDSKTFRQGLEQVINRHPELTFIIDSRGYHDSYANAIHKLNEREVMQECEISLGADDDIPLEELVKQSQRLCGRWKSPLVVTRGARGCLVFKDDKPWQIFGLQLGGRLDPVGAGDTFSATLAATVSTSTNLSTAAAVANIAAAVTAQKLFQTGTASSEEILKLGLNAVHAHYPELADCPHLARHADESEIEIVTEPLPVLNVKHAIFDHDGTISTLREGWESIMEPMMTNAILANQNGAVDEKLFKHVKNRVREFIERTTGIQTIAQMHGLVDLIREFGLVPAGQVLSAAEYKEMFNEKLISLVNFRLAKLDAGELEISDFTLKGAVPFLRTLQAAGVRLYLASGTDEADVKREAECLGYADVFDGGIYGSIGEIARDAKKIVIERIFNEVGGAFDQLIIFGDGPVEMREAKRHEAMAIGVASDELRRFGINLEKRRRLIRAGADALVPDFSQWQELWKLLRLPGRQARRETMLQEQ
jgi:rfaE bifunctional protein kinase chain/domain